jgi:hypothetical protein
MDTLSYAIAFDPIFGELETERLPGFGLGI